MLLQAPEAVKRAVGGPFEPADGDGTAPRRAAAGYAEGGSLIF